MKKIVILLSAIVIVTILLFGPNATTPAVHAQTTCLDAAGGPIPCPSTEAPSTGGGSNGNSGGGSQPGGSNPPSVVTATPSVTPTPLPTNTPLPVSDKPTENPTKNAPPKVTPTPTSEPLIVNNDKSTDTNTAPNIPWGPIGFIGLVVVLAYVLLLPAVQKFANKSTDPNPAGFDALLTIDTIPGEADGKIPNNKNPELVKNKEDEPDKALFIRFDGVDGEAHQHDDTSYQIQSDGKKKKIRRPSGGGPGGVAGPGF